MLLGTFAYSFHGLLDRHRRSANLRAITRIHQEIASLTLGKTLLGEEYPECKGETQLLSTWSPRTGTRFE